MAKVKLRTVYAGPNGCFPEGTVIDVTDQEAKDLCAAQAAEPVKEVEVETATAPPAAETSAAEPAGSFKRGKVHSRKES